MEIKEISKPLYRLLEDELQREILFAVDVDGFFVSPIQQESADISLIGTSLALDAPLAHFDDVELQVVDVRRKTIGAYYIGRIENREYPQK